MSFSEKSTSIVFQPPQMNDDEIFDEEEDDIFTTSYPTNPSTTTNLTKPHKFNIQEYNKNLNSSTIDYDYQLPCPILHTKCPPIIHHSCCCFWSKSDRKQFALELIYNKYYKVLYILIIVLTIALLIFDIASGNIFNIRLIDEPLWLLFLDIFVILLMIIDLILQIQSVSNLSFFRSKWNIFDFIIVLLCVITIPLYIFVSDVILSVVILIRFVSRVFRMYIVYKHEMFRKEYINARNSIVDFSGFDHIQESFKDNFDPGIGIGVGSKDMKYSEYGLEEVVDGGTVESVDDDVHRVGDCNEWNENVMDGEKEKVLKNGGVYQMFGSQ